MSRFARFVGLSQDQESSRSVKVVSAVVLVIIVVAMLLLMQTAWPVWTKLGVGAAFVVVIGGAAGVLMVYLER